MMMMMLKESCAKLYLRSLLFVCFAIEFGFYSFTFPSRFVLWNLISREKDTRQKGEISELRKNASKASLNTVLISKTPVAAGEIP